MCARRQLEAIRIFPQRLAVDEVDAMLDAMRARGGYISTRSNSDGSVSPYELNISYFDACRDPQDPDERAHIARFLLSQTLPLALYTLTQVPDGETGAMRLCVIAVVVAMAPCWRRW